MFIMMLILQIPTDPPTSFYALSWIALGAMAAALVYVFRQWQGEKRNCTLMYQRTIERLLAALHEQLDDPGEIDITDMK